MATKSNSKTSASSSPKKAGKPIEGAASRSRAAAGAQMPTPEELDLRDRLKSGPRRHAGPPLAEDPQPRGALEAARDAVVPAATNPKSTRGGK